MLGLGHQYKPPWDARGLFLDWRMCLLHQLTCSHIERVLEENFTNYQSEVSLLNQLRIILSFGQSKSWPYWEVSSNIKKYTHTGEDSKKYGIIWEFFPNKAISKVERVSHLGIIPSKPCFLGGFPGHSCFL